MSMTGDIFGLGSSSFDESVEWEPELQEMRLEDAEDLEEGVDEMDFMLGVAYECDMNMKNLEMAIVADEYNYLKENGEEIIYESNRIQSVIDKFKKNVKWLWNQIQKFFKQVIKKIDKALKLDKRFVDKYKKKASQRTGIYRGPELGEYTKLVGLATMVIDNLRGESARIANKYLKEGNFEDIKINSDKTVNAELKEVFDNVFKSWHMSSTSAVSDVKYKKGKSTGDVFSKLTSKLHKKKNTATRKESGKLACANLLNSKKMKNDLKKTYDNSKKLINEHLKAAKRAESATKKLRVIPTKASQAIHKVVKILTAIGKWCTQANRAAVKIINEYRSTLKTIIVSAASMSYKNKMDSDYKFDYTPEEPDNKKKPKAKSGGGAGAGAGGGAGAGAGGGAGKKNDNSSALDLYEPGMTV